MIGGLRQFSLSFVTKTKTFSQQVSNLAVSRTVLNSQSPVFGVGGGYDNGDYIGATSVTTDYVRECYIAVANW